MNSFKLELFNAKQKLSIDDLEIDSILSQHMANCDQMSEKELVTSLKESLSPYAYLKDVKILLEGMQTELEAKPLVYELKNIYHQVERKDYGLLYRDPLNKLLDIINLDNDEARMEKIINELSIYDYVPEIKMFMMNLYKSPIERQNMTHSGKGDKVYSIVEKVEDGHIVYVSDRWFHLGENNVQQTLVENHVKEIERIRNIRILEQAMSLSEVSDDRITFPIDGNLTIGISTKDGGLWINEQKTDIDSTLESLFQSPIVPYLKKDYYPLILAVKENIDKFVELDVALHVSNILKPTVECYAFNYKDKNYLYNVDKRTGSAFFEYENATSLINDVQKELDFDTTFFFENKLSKELKYYKSLEEREKKIEDSIKSVSESIEELKAENELLNEDANLKMAFDNLLIHKHNLTKQLNQVKSEKSDAKKMMINK